MTGIQSAAVPALREWMAGDDLAVFKDPDLVRMGLNLDDTFAGRVRDGVEITADGNHPFMTDTSFHCEDGVIGMRGQVCQAALFFDVGFVDHPVRCGVHPRIGNFPAPGVELGIEILQVPKRSAEKEILADIAVRPFDFAFRFCPVWLAGSWGRAVMVQQSNQSRVIGDNAIGILSGHSGFHAVIEDFLCGAATSFESCNMATQNRLKPLIASKASPEPTAVAEDHAKEPDLPADTWLVAKLKLEFSKIHLRLLAWRCFKTPLKGNLSGWTNSPREVGDSGITALIAEFTDLPKQPAAGKIGKLQNARADNLRRACAGAHGVRAGRSSVPPALVQDISGLSYGSGPSCVQSH